MRKRTIYGAYLALIVTISGSILWLSLNLGTPGDQYTNPSPDLVSAITRSTHRITYKRRMVYARYFGTKPMDSMKPTDALMHLPLVKIHVSTPETNKQGIDVMLHAPLENADKTEKVNMPSSTNSEFNSIHKVERRTTTKIDEASVLRQFNFLHIEWMNKERTNVKQNVTKSTWTKPSENAAATDSDVKHGNNVYTNKHPYNQGTQLAEELQRDKQTEVSLENELKLNNNSALNETLIDDREQDVGRVISEDNTLHKNEATVYRNYIYSKYYRRIRNRAGINCSMIITGDEAEIQRAEEAMELGTMQGIPTTTYSRITSCNNFKRSRGYIEDPLSDTERNFPIAFSLIVYKDVEQIERLLRSIYRPHNFYCVHLDIKASALERKALTNIADCFDNVFMASRYINVTWGEFSVLEAELICMEDLLGRAGWRYFINLTGQEFPLRSNREIVAVLMAMGGANVVEVEQIRARQRYFYRWTKSDKPPPHNIRPIKGAVHVAVVRHFVEYCLHDYRVRDFRAWLKMTTIPDETFFASINYNSHLEAPGGDPSDDVSARMSTFLRYKQWRPATKPLETSPVQPYCSGKFVRDVCILGVRDVSRAVASGALFVNKLHLDYQRLALDCLEEELHERTWREYLHDEQMHVHVYKTQRRLEYNIIRG